MLPVCTKHNQSSHKHMMLLVSRNSINRRIRTSCCSCARNNGNPCIRRGCRLSPQSTINRRIRTWCWSCARNNLNRYIKTGCCLSAQSTINRRCIRTLCCLCTRSCFPYSFPYSWGCWSSQCCFRKGGGELKCFLICAGALAHHYLSIANL